MPYLSTMVCAYSQLRASLCMVELGSTYSRDNPGIYKCKSLNAILKVLGEGGLRRIGEKKIDIKYK